MNILWWFRSHNTLIRTLKIAGETSRDQRELISVQGTKIDHLEDQILSMINMGCTTDVEQMAKNAIAQIDPDKYSGSLFRIYLHLRDHQKMKGIAVKPVNLAEYHSWFNSEIAPHIRANTGHGNWRMHEDLNYTTCSFNDLCHIVSRSIVPNLPYKEDIKDCDFFVRRFKDELEESYGINGGAMVTGQMPNGSMAHKLLSLKCSDFPAIVDITKVRLVYKHADANLPNMVNPLHWTSYDG